MRSVEQDRVKNHVRRMLERTIAWLEKLRNSNGSLPTSNMWLDMQRIMQSNAAVFHTQETLEEGCQLIDRAWESFYDVKLKDRSLIWCICLIGLLSWKVVD
ncbi:succinate dehydrogenase [ubiquinone] flavo subunit 1, mitochondrial isoform X2 [Olea europaea subsp. europaea]|uniref:Succinate dehydrogenase [ubiquinone] flavo subunit 1, mitochondrial isoform X2 n=1 Tax=Olea europaea subsp. europaea TaxID=158383 RepID=A0A8S0Q492_OLEEU|nr:succinate dehydrogenase [ubiquinone] flavo subunit 1, mitochondrial isoform X2 [Olea europaea subsp. europaea]